MVDMGGLWVRLLGSNTLEGGGMTIQIGMLENGVEWVGLEERGRGWGMGYGVWGRGGGNEVGGGGGKGGGG